MRRILPFMLLLALASPTLADEFIPVAGPCGFAFPRDHAPHPGYKTEWWYYTGSLIASSGEHFGFQFTLFRAQLKPSGIERTWPRPHSAWRSNQILLGNAAVTDVSRHAYHQAELACRQALDLAGWRSGESGTELFLRDWSLAITPDRHAVRAKGSDFSYALTLTPRTGPVAHGDGGYSLKGSRPESASCYYSLPRLDVSGELVLGGKPMAVSGQAWMDHEYSSASLEPGILGWDWFGLRLSDGSELMAFFLRQAGGGYSPASSATLVAPDGSVAHVPAGQLRNTPSGSWTSPRSKARYPSAWKLSAPGVELEVAPEAADQEMNTPLSTGVNYWEGLVRVKGTRDGRPVTGEGYVELTGYDKAFTARY